MIKTRPKPLGGFFVSMTQEKKPEQLPGTVCFLYNKKEIVVSSTEREVSYYAEL